MLRNQDCKQQCAVRSGGRGPTCFPFFRSLCCLFFFGFCLFLSGVYCHQRVRTFIVLTFHSKTGFQKNTVCLIFSSFVFISPPCIFIFYLPFTGCDSFFSLCLKKINVCFIDVKINMFFNWNCCVLQEPKNSLVSKIIWWMPMWWNAQTDSTDSLVVHDPTVGCLSFTVRDASLPKV